MQTKISGSILALALSALVSACVAAAAGAGGAAAGIYFTTRGVAGLVNGTVPDVARRAEAVLAELGIVVTEREYKADGSEVEIEGRTDDLEIDVDIERETATTTRVEVSARRSAVEWDKDYARMILERIVSKE